MTENTPSISVLVVDDDRKQRELVAEMIQHFGFTAVAASGGKEALDLQLQLPADVIVTDLIMPGGDGFELLRGLQERGDRTPAIVMTSFGSPDKAVSIVHDYGAYWFLEKPIQPATLRALLERAATQKSLIEETELLNRQLSYRGVLGDLIGASAPMQEVYSLISQAAPTTASVLITGESGTGKELVARAIHRLSPRSQGPFVAVNCAALPETLIESELFGHEKGAFTGAIERRAGCFEQANSGTVLLDEIGEMPIGTQAKLLRFLEERKVRRLGGRNDLPVDVRVVSATNRPPEAAIKDKMLREDLYYRLNVFHIALPPLRDRKEDVPAIAEAMINDLNKKHACRITDVHPVAMDRLRTYSWPGNVRELRNVMERAVILAGEGTILLRHLPADRFSPSAESLGAAPRDPQASIEPGDGIVMNAGLTIREVEETYINWVLKQTGNNKTKAADLLGMSIRTLHHRLGEMREKSANAISGV